MTAATTIDPQLMRTCMSQFASGVTVVTGIDEAGNPLGFACQSFASLSLDPALILICVDHGGRSWPQIAPSGKFSVNVLAEEQGDLVSRFGSSRGQRFEGLDWHESPLGTPALPDTLLRVDCEVHEVLPGGDHDIVVGRVQELALGEPNAPMLFFRGKIGIRKEIRVESHTLGWGWE
ncbi:flavin reductase family protein [Nocardioides sp. Bht2]|uniref:flavin reductase family protein n=1 Tax=Nocardioides sp. Bht2 TaxID=3392297 RepID=UPI0039B58F28